MPYVSKEIREDLEKGVITPTKGGELNYLVTRLCIDYIRSTRLSYSAIEEVIDAIMEVQLVIGLLPKGMEAIQFSSELAYLIYELCGDIVEGVNIKPEVTLECVKLEFYRRMAAPYEDKKIEENGDVY